MSFDYSFFSLSLIKFSAQTVKVLVSKDVNIITYKHENRILYYHFCSLFSQYLRKGKKQNGFLIDSESSNKELQNQVFFDFFRGGLC